VSELELFDSGEPRVTPTAGAESVGPLAARMRPRSVDEFMGQGQLVGEGMALRRMLESGEIASMILWGPPGSGKTTLAGLLAEGVDATFVSFSAVTEGVPRVRAIIKEAKARRQASDRGTILFCDEIHRFNKAQQDAFLPHVEDGTIVLIGATTENPSFAIVRPLLSRAPVYVLEALGTADIRRILAQALSDGDRGLEGMGLQIADSVLDRMAEVADGDARRALGILDAAARLAGVGGCIDTPLLEQAVQHRFAAYDKGGEEHFNIISALHKSVRGSDPDAALYWLARMLEAGEDPLYVARRLVRMASEDIGLADPQALSVTMAARDAFQFLGPPEGELALAQVVLYLATAPKSNRTYLAWKAARDLARESPAAPVPLHLRNAPTGLMKELGYGKDYAYDPDQPDGVSAQEYLPEGFAETRFYDPGPYGHERVVRKRLEWWNARRGSSGTQGEASSEPGDFSTEPQDPSEG
jgi:putative ATPase